MYGEATLSDNLKLFSDPYDFEYHSLNSSKSVSGKVGVAARNALTFIGALNVKAPPGASGYLHEFYNTPYCPTCSPLPKRK